MVIKFKEGQRVWCPIQQKIAEIYVIEEGGHLPVFVINSTGNYNYYNLDGRWGSLYLLTENEYNCKVRIRSIKLKQ